MNLSRPQLVVVVSVCAALVVAGIVVYRAAPTTTAFGWFAYSPLPDQMPVPPNPARTNQQLVGLILASLGAIGGLAAAGYGAVGRHRSRR